MRFISLVIACSLLLGCSCAALADDDEQDCCVALDPDFYADPFDERDLRETHEPEQTVVDLCRVTALSTRDARVSVLCGWDEIEKPYSMSVQLIRSDPHETLTVGSTAVCVMKKSTADATYNITLCNQCTSIDSDLCK